MKNNQSVHARGFTLMEMLVSMALLAIAFVIAVQIAEPLRLKLEKNIRILREDTQYLFALSFLDSLVRSSDQVEISPDGQSIIFDAAACAIEDRHETDTNIANNMWHRRVICTFAPHDLVSPQRSFAIMHVKGAGHAFASSSSIVPSYILKTEIVDMQFGFLPKLTYNLVQ